MFGKPGRPPEDRLARQCEIYEAIAPYLLAGDVRSLTMRQAARISCLSIGGLYHYFPTKRDLALYALQPSASARRCQDFWARYGQLEREDPPLFREALVDAFVGTVQFIRPAIRAALEMGAKEFWDDFETHWYNGTVEFAEALHRSSPRRESIDSTLLRRAVRRLFFGAIFDRDLSPEEVRAEFASLVDGQPLVLAPHTSSFLAGDDTNRGTAVLASTRR